jgi:hypothetical protein
MWELQPSDTVKAFRAFCIYRELGADRSLREVARRLGLSASQIEKWSSANGWHKRCLAYDAHVYKQEQARRAEEVQRIRKHETTLSQALISLVMRRVVGYDGGGNSAKVVAALDPNTLNARDIPFSSARCAGSAPLASVGNLIFDQPHSRARFRSASASHSNEQRPHRNLHGLPSARESSARC